MRNKKQKNDPLASTSETPKFVERTEFEKEQATKHFIKQYEQGFVMEEWKTRQGVDAYRWVAKSSSKEFRTIFINDKAYDIYQRNVA